MTKRDFELIACVVRDSRPRGDFFPQAIAGRALTEADAIDRVAELFADRLARTNPRFDRSRFLRACGMEGAEAVQDDVL